MGRINSPSKGREGGEAGEAGGGQGGVREGCREVGEGWG